MAQATITRTIHVGDKAIPISDHRVVDLLRDGVIYECGDGHDLHIDPSAYANVDALERLLSGIAEASAPMPAGSEVKGLPVAGYKPTQSQESIDLVNEGKILEERVLRWIEKAAEYEPGGMMAYRFLLEGQKAIETGFMLCYRSVFQPHGSRIKLPEDEA